MWFVLLTVLSAVLTRLALGYARSRRLLDQPGQRRSHVVPTPRGGGIAIVATVVVSVPFLAWKATSLAWIVVLALLAVAGIGWLDDHRPQPVIRRLLIHTLAALALALALPAPGMLSPALAWLFIAVCVVFLVACINAWNFMDGSHGLLASQCLWLGVVLGVWALLSHASVSSWTGLAWVSAAACLGFLPFNFPRAAIFLGDVGSGALGLLGGLLLWMAWVTEPAQGWALVLLPSALLVDASLTLASRIVSGRRWYTAHREHLYQWLIRSGRSHAQVAMLYMAWNLGVVVPALAAMQVWPARAASVAVAVLWLACGLWWFGKRAILTHRRARGRGIDPARGQGRN